jgi:hypothetical protein
VGAGGTRFAATCRGTTILCVRAERGTYGEQLELRIGLPVQEKAAKDDRRRRAAPNAVHSSLTDRHTGTALNHEVAHRTKHPQGHRRMTLGWANRNARLGPGIGHQVPSIRAGSGPRSDRRLRGSPGRRISARRSRAGRRSSAEARTDAEPASPRRPSAPRAQRCG